MSGSVTSEFTPSEAGEAGPLQRNSGSTTRMAGGMSSNSMKRVTVRPGEIVLVDADRPTPRSGEILVESTVIGVCGSDTHAAAGHHPFVPLPYNPGHEVVGVVRELGTDTTGVQVGDRVIVEPTLPCWGCKMCTSGRINLCENLRFFGCVYDQGGMADFFTVPANRVHVVPDELTDLQAVLIEPLSTPVHAVRLSGDIAGKAVAIMGAGPSGSWCWRRPATSVPAGS